MTTGPSREPDRAVRGRCVRALVDHSWMSPKLVRPAARLHVVMMVVALTAAGVLGAGVVSQIIAPVELPTPTPTAPVTRDAAPFTALSGWDCAQTADFGFEAAGRTSRWRTVARGGWNDDGCHGTFAAIPLSGNRDKDDQGVSAVWWFAPPPASTRCAMAVFVADPERPADSGASAAQYFVLDGRGGQRLAGFVLDQRAHRGSWVEVGTFPVGPGGIAVQLVNRGVPATAGAALALTQVRVRCTT